MLSGGTAVIGRRPDARGAAVDEQELIGWARERLAGYETPKRIVFAAVMPEAVGGKVRKHELRAQLS